MYLIITTRPNIATRLTNHDPFVISQMFNRLKVLFDTINKSQGNQLTSEQIIDDNMSSIYILLVMLSLHIDNVPKLPTFNGGSIKTRRLHGNKKSKKDKKDKNSKGKNTKKYKYCNNKIRNTRKN